MLPLMLLFAVSVMMGCKKEHAVQSVTADQQSDRKQELTAYNPVFGMTSEGGDWNLWKTNDGLIASSRSQSTPFVPIRHTYETSIPSTFASSKAGVETAYGQHVTMVNMKCDWGQLASGALNTQITNYLNSIPSGMKVFLTFNHEPENNGAGGAQPSPADRVTWCKGQALANALVHNTVAATKCEYFSCVMSWTFNPASGRTPSDYNPGPYMTTAEKAYHIYACDIYFTMPATGSGPFIYTKAGTYKSDAQSWGFSRLGFAEIGLNNDAGNTNANCAAWLHNTMGGWVRNTANGVVFCVYFNNAGPVNGTSPYIDDSLVERQAFADLVLGN